MRSAGILLPVFSLPSPYGIGTLGKSGYDFIDFLSDSGMCYWQILPLAPAGEGNSPYRSSSAFAGNTYFIDLDLLREDGLLKDDDFADIPVCQRAAVDYDALHKYRRKILKKAAESFLKSPPGDFFSFTQKEEYWLEDHALFTAIKETSGDLPLCKFDKDLMSRDDRRIAKEKARLAREIKREKALQYIFFKQWEALHRYALSRGIKIIGDIPIYVAPDSSDVWAHPECFILNADLSPTLVAGCPPDDFAKTGQLWGNPVFCWERMKRDGYSWWKERIVHSLAMFDIVRIDHFRGFESFYAVPSSEKTAEKGEWMKGPGIDFFDSLNEKFGTLPIIAEDLGHITKEVTDLRERCSFMGMRVLEFGFDGRNDEHMPHNFVKDCVAYIGTHDNDTALGWIENADEKTAKTAIKYLRLSKNEGYAVGMIRSLLASTAELVILQMQDLLSLGSEGRINIPGKAEGNWKWRCDADAFDKIPTEDTREMLKIYKRTSERTDAK